MAGKYPTAEEIREHRKELRKKLKMGVLYEDCRFHPMVCIGVNWRTGSLLGISLIDGSVSNCDVDHCGVTLLTPFQAMRNRLYGLPKKQVEKMEAFHEEWLDKKSLKEYRRRKEKDRQRGIHFPHSADSDVNFVELMWSKKLRRKSDKRGPPKPFSF